MVRNKNNQSLKILKMKNNKILQILKKYIAKQKQPIDLEILKTEILLLFKHNKERRRR